MIGFLVGIGSKAVQSAEVAGFEERGELCNGKCMNALAARAFDLQGLLQFLKKQSTALAT